MNWPVKKLGDICEIISGATPSTSVSEYWGDVYFWATPKDLSDLNASEIETTSRKISALGLKSCAATLLPINSVLFSSRAPIGLVAINKVPIATNQGFKNLVPNKNLVDTRYLYYWLRCNRKKIDAMGVGATFKEVSKAIVSKIEIPIPPLAEQQRIAAVLDTADRILKQRELAFAKLDQLAQSVFVEMFGSINGNEKKFVQMKLTEFFKFKTGKLDSNAAIDNGIYPFFTCSKEDFAINEYAFDEEALLLAGNNATADYSVKHYKGKFNAYQRTYVINLADSNNSYAYAKACLQLKLMQLKSVSKGTNTKYLTMGIFREMTMNVPPKDLQINFEKRIHAIDLVKSKNKEDLNILKKLIDSLQHQSFAVN